MFPQTWSLSLSLRRLAGAVYSAVEFLSAILSEFCVMHKEQESCNKSIRVIDRQWVSGQRLADRRLLDSHNDQRDEADKVTGYRAPVRALNKSTNASHSASFLHQINASLVVLLPGRGPAGLGWYKRDDLSPQDLRNNLLTLCDLTLIVSDSVYMGGKVSPPELLPPYDGPLLTMPPLFTLSYCPYLFIRPIVTWKIKSLDASRLEDVDIGPYLHELRLDSLQFAVAPLPRRN
ncbi:hypothetical protein BDZ89DRAFT_1229795 [Hymenopellis radicata]|nr:hypothetical protein BDZ89DRAFT_1229795 [Hymenopellis radicata]